MFYNKIPERCNLFYLWFSTVTAFLCSLFMRCLSLHRKIILKFYFRWSEHDVFGKYNCLNLRNVSNLWQSESFIWLNQLLANLSLFHAKKPRKLLDLMLIRKVSYRKRSPFRLRWFNFPRDSIKHVFAHVHMFFPK